MKKFMKFVAFAAVAGVGMGAAESAQAGTVDIVNYIDSEVYAPTYGQGVNDAPVGQGNERILTGNVTIEDSDGNDITITAYGAAGVTPATDFGQDNDNDGIVEHAYLDWNGAGMGVCSGGASATGHGKNACTTASDDNVGVGGSGIETEILTISLDQEWDVQTLYFRDDGHNATFEANSRIEVGLDDGGGGIDWTTYTLIDGNALGSVLDGFGPLENFAAGSVIHLRSKATEDNYPDTQFYLSGLLLEESDEAVVPLPAGLLLMLSGLFGLGFLGRFKSKIG